MVVCPVEACKMGRIYYGFHMKEEKHTVSVAMPVQDWLRIPAENRSEFIRDAIGEKLARMEKAPWRPKTSVGRKLIQLRQQFIANGGELLDSHGLAAELRERRGGLA
jgi:hypothetical protein